MTVAPHARPIAAGSIEEVVQAIRGAGGRVSAPCRGVLDALFAAEGPVSAEYIAAGLDGRATRIDLVSVYRNLERLEDLGAVVHVHLGHGAGLYALAGSDPLEYLVCERCHRVRAVAPQDLDGVRGQVRERFGFEARFSHFPIVGLCSACAGAGNPAGRSAPHEHEHAHADRIHSHPHAHAPAADAHRHSH